MLFLVATHPRICLRIVGRYIDFLDAYLFMQPSFCKHIAYRVESSCVSRVFYKYLVILISLFLSPVWHLNFFLLFLLLILKICSRLRANYSVFL